MLARLFGHINSSTNFLLVIWAVIVCSLNFFAFGNDRLIFETLWGEIHFLPWAVFAIQLLSLLSISFAAQWLIDYKHHLVKRHAYFPFFLMPMLLMFAGSSMNLFILFLLLVLVLGGWLSIYTGENVYSRVLNTGLLIGIGSVVDLRVAMLIPFTYIVYTILGRFNLRTSLIVLIGFFSIWLNALGLEFIIYDTTTFWDYFLGIFNWQKDLGIVELNVYLLTVLGLLSILGLFELPKTLSRASVFKRQSYVIISILLALTGVGFALFSISIFQLAVVLFTGLILFVNFFQYAKRLWVKETIMWLTIAMFVIFQYDIL